MPDNRPRSREKNVTGKAGDLSRRGSGLGTGPVGNKGSRADASTSLHAPSGGTSSSGPKRSGGRLPLIAVIAILLLSGGGLSGILGGGSDPAPAPTAPAVSQQTTSTPSQTASPSSGLSGLLGGSFLSTASTSSGWTYENNTGRLNTEVASNSRAKRTVLSGDGSEQITIMVYMCGTDLESRSGMASSDLKEMASANLSDQINLIVFTGGCKAWKTSAISSSVNQIWQVKNGSMTCLEADMGKKAMTDPSNLTTFIQYCARNFPADRQELIFWDHGGGSLTGYGYDEKNSSSGSMTLAGIDSALKSAGETFDFIGFDACLMATLETGLMLDPYADYLIASEETEPGVGWYYTDWLNALSKDPSMPTITLGSKIADDFVRVCGQTCSGQKTTLSVVDLAELSATVPAALKEFSSSTQDLIIGKQYETVSSARTGAREFAVSSRIDQVDLVDLAMNMGTEEGAALADTLLSAVKYNKTSSNMTNAYGISIYFPYKKVSKVDSAVNTYRAIGLDPEYSECIKSFAALETEGQVVNGGSSASSPINFLLGSGSAPQGGTDMISGLLGTFLGGDFGTISGLSLNNTEFLSGKTMSEEDTVAYLSNHHIDASDLDWTVNDQGENVISLTDSQWSLIHDLTLNVYYDDGEGYIDLGYDNIFSFDESGNLLDDYDGSWLAINDQVVPYYYIDTVDDGTNYTITGYIPAFLNGERVQLIVIFDQDSPYGYIAGARNDYFGEDVDVIAKTTDELVPGDQLDFICDYYSYEGDYLDSYYLGDTLIVSNDMVLSNLELDADRVNAAFCFTDLYQNRIYSPAVTVK